MNKFNFFKDKKVIITGHTGFKGSWLSFWMQILGAKVLGISNGYPTKPSNFKDLNLIKIFLVTSKKDDLKDRLLKRNQDSPDQLDKRLKAFDEDIKHWKDYDYIVINQSLENCFKHIDKIILSHKEAKLAQIVL